MMTPRYATEELALMMPTTLSNFFDGSQDRRAAYHHEYDSFEAFVPKKPGPVARLATWMRRRAAMQQLSAMTDHELADVGLNRADLAMAFDTNFAAQHNADRYGTKLQSGRIQLV